MALLLAVAFPLWKPLLVGAVLAAALLPWHDWLSERLRGRRRLFGWLAHVTPPRAETLAIAAQLARASQSVLSSLFLTALAQSVTATIGYLIARVPHPMFFGLLTFLAAFIPSVGTTII